jgi:hypothetical protein
MPCLRQYPASFFSLRGLVWATNQRNSDTPRIILEPALDVNLKLRVRVAAGAVGHRIGLGKTRLEAVPLCGSS